MTDKRCCECGETKALDEFHREGKSKDGRRPSCKVCRCATARARHDAQRDELLTRRRESYREDPHRQKASAAAWRTANRERALEVQRNYYVRNKETVQARIKAWQNAHPDKLLEYNRRNGPKRRAWKAGAYIEAIDVDALVLRDEGRCGICGEDLYPIPGRVCFDVDHIVPLALGGSHEMANVQLSHPACNRSKGGRMLDAA